MSITIPTTEPAEILAGDTLEWTKSLANYPASDGYTLKYRLINAAGKIDITASASGDDHAVSVTATTTAAYTPGTYTWTSFVEAGEGATLERRTIATGTIEIKPSLATQAAGYDTRSHAKIMIDAIEAILEGRATYKDIDVVTKSSGDISITRDPGRLRSERNKYLAEYRAELRRERIKQGKRGGGRVAVRF